MYRAAEVGLEFGVAMIGLMTAMVSQSVSEGGDTQSALSG